MFAVIFELQPKQEKFDEYLKLAKYLRRTRRAHGRGNSSRDCGIGALTVRVK